MASTTTSSAEAKTSFVFKVFTIVIFAVMIAAAIAVFLLPRPYDAIGHVVMYVVLAAGIAVKLRTCLRLAQGSEYLSKLHGLGWWIVAGVLAVLPHLRDLFRTQDRVDYIRLATNLFLYLALLSALELVESLLKRTTAGSGSSGAASNATGTTTGPNQPFQQTGLA
jgi:hypothetical protein